MSDKDVESEEGTEDIEDVESSSKNEERMEDPSEDKSSVAGMDGIADCVKWDPSKYPYLYKRENLQGADVRKSPLLAIDVADGKDITTIWELFDHVSNKVPEKEYLGDKPSKEEPFRYISYGRTREMALAVGRALVSEPFSLKPGDRIAFYAQNRAAYWVMVFGACSQSLPFVSLYDSLGKDSTSFILGHAGVKVVFVSSGNIPKLKQAMTSFSDPPAIVVLDDREWCESEYRERKGEMEADYTFTEMVEMGMEKKDIPIRAPDRKDMLTIMYTSGTTSVPKGVVLSHSNVVAGYLGLYERLGPVRDTSHDHSYFSFLPLAHVLSLCCELTLTRMESRIGFWRGDRETLVDDMGVCAPTVLAAVPRFYQRIYDVVMNTLDDGGALKRTIFNGMFAWKKYWVAKGKSSAVASKVFHPVRQKLGGRLLTAVSTAAPLPTHLAWFCRVVLVDIFLEGWGMTELTGAAASQQSPMTAPKWYGHNGFPLTTCEVKLVDVPEMEYMTTDKPWPRGEVCVRGPIVCQGYYKDEEKTRELIDEEGWLHSGDIGCWRRRPGAKGDEDADGCLQIIDRMKSLIKMAQGEYVSPERIEGILGSSLLVSQSWAYGNSFQEFVISVVVPDYVRLKDLVKASGVKVDEMSTEELCANEKAAALMLEEVQKVAKVAGMSRLEMPKAVILSAVDFSVENDMLTPSLKNRRHCLLKHFQDKIDAIYSKKGAKK